MTSRTRAVGGGRRTVERVEQLAERHRRRHRRAGALVGSGVGDDQVVAGGADGVEQELAVLAARVALADPRVAGEHVVAVADALPREHAVVEAEQADDAVGDRAHRHERADGERAGAEARSCRPAGEGAVEQGANVGQAERCGAACCGFRDVAELRAQLRFLPGRVVRRRGEAQDGVLEAGRPLLGGVASGHELLRRGEPVDQLCEASGQVDVGAVDVVERHDVAVGIEGALHADAEQQPVEPGAPGALVDRARVAKCCGGRCRVPTGRRRRRSSRAAARSGRRRSRTAAVRRVCRRGRAPGWP